MTDESKDLKTTPEMHESDLTGASGGSFVEDMVGGYYHKGCGGKLELHDFLGIPVSWCCTVCGECHDSLESFDYYTGMPIA